MSTELLLREFERIAEAPDLVAHLRRFVLDLAVRGRLVEQTSSEGTGADLLSMARRVCERSSDRVSREADLRSTGEIAEPYELPSTWIWARFGDIARFSAGRTPSRNDPSFWNSGDYPWVSIADMPDGGQVMATRETVSPKAKEHVFKVDPEPAGTMIMSFKLTIGKIARLGVAAYHNEAIISVTPWVRELDAFLFLALPERARRGATKGAIKGATLNRDSLGSLLVPLPPLAEQHRIVAKVHELMALCDQLEAVQTEREVRRDGLRETSLHRLTASDGKDTTSLGDVRFFLDRSPRLITKPEHVAAVRQMVLHLAVRGRLVPQDPADQPAAELLKRIRSRNDAAGTRPATQTSRPFDIPFGWAWCRFADVGTFGRGKSKHRPRNDPSLYIGGTHPFIQTGDVARSGGTIRTFTSRYNDVGLAQSAMWPAGTLCITIAANIADSGILAFDACFPDSVVGLIVSEEFPDSRYFDYFLRTAKAELLAFAPSTAQKNINLSILNEVVIPLPPLRELRRIVAKLNRLMAVCDELEAALATSQAGRGRLLEALLHEALKGAGVPKFIGAGTAG